MFVVVGPKTQDSSGFQSVCHPAGGKMIGPKTKIDASPQITKTFKSTAFHEFFSSFDEEDSSTQRKNWGMQETGR